MRRIDIFELISAVLALGFWFSSFFARHYFEVHGVRAPDFKNGKIYPLHSHGTVVYLTFGEHYFLYGSMLAAGVFILLALVFHYIVNKHLLKKLAEEEGLTPLIHEGATKLWPGFRLGENLVSWRISLYDDFVVIVIGSGKPLLVRYEGIEWVKYKNCFSLNKTVIKGNNPKFNVSLYHRSTKKLTEVFRNKGVNVIKL